MPPRRAIVGWACAVVLGVVGCGIGYEGSLTRVDLDAGHVTAAQPSVAMAGGEIVGVQLAVDGNVERLRIERPDGSPVRLAAAYRVLSATVDRRDPAIVRDTGRADGVASVPVALLPLDVDDPTTSAGTVWLDLSLDPGTPAGEHALTVVGVGPRGRDLATARIVVTSRGFDLPLGDDRLVVAGVLDAQQLAAAWPRTFGGTSLTTLARDDRQPDAVATLDAMMALAASANVEVHPSGLRPRFPPPFGEIASTDWRAYDALVGPWLDAENAPRAFPMPKPLDLWRFGRERRGPTWRHLVAHFDAAGWLDNVVLHLEPADLLRHAATRDVPGASAALVREADAIAPLWPDARLILDAAALAVADTTGGALVEAAGWFEPSREDDRDLPSWLATSASDGRRAGWLAARRGARVVKVHGVLSPADKIDADAWFHPGGLLGVDEPVVAGLGLMRARRAAFDHAYLAAGDSVDARRLADAIARPVVVPVALRLAAGVGVLADTAEASAAYDDALDLAAASARGEPLPHAWPTAIAPDPRPTLSRLRWDLTSDVGRGGLLGGVDRRRLTLRADVVARQATPPEPEGLSLSLANLPPGWQPGPPPAPTSPPPIGTAINVAASASAPVDRLDGTGPRSAVFADLHDGTRRPTPIVAPAAKLVPLREPPSVDGDLGDWSYEASLHRGPLVSLATLAPTSFDGPEAELLAGATDEALFLAFKTPSSGGGGPVTSNTVRRIAGRVAGEDAVEVVLRPTVYDSGDPRPVETTRVTLKANGVATIERRDEVSGRWQPAAFEHAYACTIGEDGSWRGELALPWDSLSPPTPGRLRRSLPELTAMNVTRYDGATGAAGSWAGPTDAPGEAEVAGALVLPADVATVMP